MKIINIFDSWVITILLRKDKEEFTDRFVKGANKKCRSIEKWKNIPEKGRIYRKRGEYTGKGKNIPEKGRIYRKKGEYTGKRENIPEKGRSEEN